MHPSFRCRVGDRGGDISETGIRGAANLLILRRLVAGSTGLEPAASGVTGRRSNQLNYDPDVDAGWTCILRTISRRTGWRECLPTAARVASEGWWAVRVSNPRQPACKAGALPLS